MSFSKKVADYFSGREDDLIDILGITSEDIVKAFASRINANKAELRDYLPDDDYVQLLDKEFDEWQC